jgi:hypothetical protein
VNGGISPTAGEVTAFGASVPPCYVCTVSERMWERERLSYTCRGFASGFSGIGAPTTAMAASAVAAMQVQHALVRISPSRDAPRGLDDGQKALISLSPPAMMVTTLRTDPECGSHERWEPVARLGLGPARVTGCELLRRCGCPDGAVELPGEVLVSVRCAACEKERRVGVPLRSCTESLLTCPACGEPDGEPWIASELRAHERGADLALSQVGVCRRQVLRVRAADGRAPLYVEIG